MMEKSNVRTIGSGGGGSVKGLFERRAVAVALLIVAIAAGSASASLASDSNSGSSGANADVQLTVGNLVELTGVAAFLGPPFVQAGNTAMTIDQPGSFARKGASSVKTVTADTQGDPQAALLAARSAVDRGSTCLIGPASTPESLSIANALSIQRRSSSSPRLPARPFRRSKTRTQSLGLFLTLRRRQSRPRTRR